MYASIHSLPSRHRPGLFKGADGCLRLLWRALLYTLIQALIYSFIHFFLQNFLYLKLHIMDLIILPFDVLLHLTLVLLATYLFWRYVDKRPWRGWRQIGLIPLRSGLPFALRGVLLISITAALGYGSFVALGWMHILSFNPTPIFFLALLIDMIPRLIDEPFCEEIAMRGYLYSTLNMGLPRWLAALAQVGCFTLFCALLTGFAAFSTAVQGQPFPYPPGIIALYLLAIALFGGILQLCVLNTSNLWMGIGLHLFAIEFPIMVITPHKTLFQIALIPLFNGVERFHVLVDIPEIGYFVLTLVVLLFIALRIRRINWQARLPETAELSK
ncbi:CPBP family intramembrane metalloprotease [Ktedonosporobacter rubrisoli]|uniref:CPBP family intramembrane metalloprotease n=1 Tax=Ktedonosporobacter rubrisoli TaxID=2509675 RepID=A0A4P6JNR8_KTERU|nr:CPBP family glutamic-type intramembrane protease [Ktedonosporobacter rubrisoli]QBD76386.1 CPBP family intramembrane metalloprotease [Ktedonosporobacter rubrisoli]